MTQPLDDRTGQRDFPLADRCRPPRQPEEGSTDDRARGGSRYGKVIYHDQSEYRKGVGVITKGVALPEDVADPDTIKASGLVELPLHVHWWAPFRLYDLTKPRDRRAVYRQVLDNGTPDDVRRYIEVDKLVEMWDTIKLPSHVRYVWDPWLREKGFLP